MIGEVCDMYIEYFDGEDENVIEEENVIGEVCDMYIEYFDGEDEERSNIFDLYFADKLEQLE